MKHYVLIGCVVLGLSGTVWGEQCLEEKLRIQELTQQNAQLQVNNAQLLFNAANVEKTRLEEIKKANGTSTAPAPAASPAAVSPTTPAAQ